MSASGLDASVLPEWMLEDVPEAHRRLLAGRQAAAQPDRGEGVRQNEIDRLRDQGFVVTHDARGMRISGNPILSRGQGTGRLNASDVIRLASQMDGGPRQVRRCPHCDANIPMDAARCPWCGKPSSA